jgi:predicted TIM-barrel fold metal-dependent hydrolase
MRDFGGAGLTRRGLLSGAAALGAATMLPGTSTAAPPAMAPGTVDVHHHFFPPFFIEMWRDNPRVGALIPGIRDWTPAASLAQMDRNHVAQAVLSTSSRIEAFGLPPDRLRDIVRRFNDYATQVKHDHRGRFGLFAFLPLPDVDASLAEIARALDDLHAEGIGITTSYAGKYPGDPEFAPVMDELNRRKTTVFVHPLAPACCNALMSYVPPTLIEYPEDTARAMLSLLLSGTLRRCRDITWIFSHAGGTWPMLAGRTATLARDQVKNLKDVAPDGIDAEFRRFYYETANSAYKPTMAALLAYAPLRQVMFGTDYPYVTVDENVADFHALHLGAAQVQAISRDNARRLFPRLGG